MLYSLLLFVMRRKLAKPVKTRLEMLLPRVALLHTSCTSQPSDIIVKAKEKIEEGLEMYL